MYLQRSDLLWGKLASDQSRLRYWKAIKVMAMRPIRRIDGLSLNTWAEKQRVNEVSLYRTFFLSLDIFLRELNLICYKT